MEGGQRPGVPPRPRDWTSGKSMRIRNPAVHRNGGRDLGVLARPRDWRQFLKLSAAKNRRLRLHGGRRVSVWLKNWVI